MSALPLHDPAVRLGALAGTLGGVALVAVPALGSRGPLILVPYALLVLALTGLAGLHRTFGRWQRFGLVLTGFLVASLVLYLYIILVDNPSALSIPLVGHAWRLAFLVVVGTVLAAAAAFATERASHTITHG